MSFSSEIHQGLLEERLILGLAQWENKVSLAVPGGEGGCSNDDADRLEGHRSQLTRAPTGQTGHDSNIRHTRIMKQKFDEEWDIRTAPEYVPRKHSHYQGERGDLVVEKAGGHPLSEVKRAHHLFCDTAGREAQPESSGRRGQTWRNRWTMDVPPENWPVALTRVGKVEGRTKNFSRRKEAKETGPLNGMLELRVKPWLC